jgi:hypothetical protein
MWLLSTTGSERFTLVSTGRLASIVLYKDPLQRLRILGFTALLMLVFYATATLTIQKPRFPILVFNQNSVKMQDFVG